MQDRMKTYGSFLEKFYKAEKSEYELLTHGDHY